MMAYASKANAYQQYKEQNILTAGPGELTLMLYDGCIKNLKLAKMHFEDGNIEKRNEALIKAQNIISELVGSLDMQYELSEQLLNLYEYMIYCLRDANIYKDTSKLDIVVDLMADLRETWSQAIKMPRVAPVDGGVYEKR